MKVAMVRPPNLGNKVRGTGFYAERLFKALSLLPDLELSWMSYSKNPFAYQKYDIVHFPYFDLFSLTIPPIRVSRTIVTLHDVTQLKFPAFFPQGKKAKAIWPVQRKILQGVDAIITDSENSKRDIVELAKVKAGNITVTYLASDPKFQPLTDKSHLRKIKDKFGLPDEFVLYVGGVNWNKNVSSLIKACPTDLVLVGNEFTRQGVDLNHIELQPFKEILELTRNNTKVKLLGFVETEDLAGIYSLASVYVQPSIYEGFGLPVLEAMSCGTPVISSQGGSLPEIGGNAVNYVETTNVTELKEKITEMLSLSKSEKQKIIEKGKNQAKKFSWDKCAAETYELYQKVLAGV